VASVEDLSSQELSVEEFLLGRGNYELRIRAKRYLDYVAMLEVEGRDQQQTVTAELIPGWADVRVTTDPSGAEVSSGDEVLGTTPGTIELMAGTRQIVIRKPGFRTEQRTLSVVAGQQETLPLIELEEAGGLISLTSSPSGSAVTLNGVFAGNTPVDLEVAKGQSHLIQLSQVGYKTARRNVDVPDGTPVSVQVALQPKLGIVRMTARPADAQLFVDGRSQGKATQNLELLAIPHRLEVRKSGYETWTRQVTPKPGLPQSFDVQLLTPEQAKIAAMPRTLNTSLGQTLQLIRPGEFVMGAPRREQGRRPNEVRRPVRLERWFYMSREEVSNKEFRVFKPTHTSGAQKYRELAFDSSPVVMVSWNDAAAYCNWLSKRDGLEPAYERDGKSWVLSQPVREGYRLPTEAEWAWVARFDAGQGERKYPWGSGMPPPNNSGNYADMAAEDVASSTIVGYNDGFPVTSPGGAFPANPNGIFDLGGNVAEWVNDRYSVARNSTETLIDPTGPSEGQYHGIRGSSWRHSSISELRLAYRDFGDKGRLDVGFRIARYAKPAER
ncbi:MAG: SUMF1/EgtB/PvdO family nonheme iron enzyme, partial [Gammaproteobacteria bacterium]